VHRPSCGPGNYLTHLTGALLFAHQLPCEGEWVTKGGVTKWQFIYLFILLKASEKQEIPNNLSFLEFA